MQQLTMFDKPKETLQKDTIIQGQKPTELTKSKLSNFEIIRINNNQQKPIKTEPKPEIKSEQKTEINSQTNNEFKLVNHSFIGHTGKIYIANPVNGKSYTVYESKKDYNNRNKFLDIIDKEEAMRDFEREVKINRNLKIA